MSVSSTDSPLDRVPIVQGVIAGVVAWVVSLLVVLLLVAATEDGDDLFNSAGNLLYNAHFVDTKREVSSSAAMGGSSSETYNVLSEGATDLPEFVYYAVPIVVLLGTGIAVARFAALEDEQEAAIAGALAAVGYLVLTIVGTFLFTWEQSTSSMAGSVSYEISPELGAMTILVMGIAYPAVVGGIGGLIGSRL